MPLTYNQNDSFDKRHIGPSDADQQSMLKELGYDSLEELIQATIPSSIRVTKPISLSPAIDEAQCLKEMDSLASQNKIYTNYIGQGYYPCNIPSVILRNILENPQWYTPYTPYQAEISQGRLEALLNFQTVTTELTGLPIASASLLDEATAAAEAMTLCARLVKRNENRSTFLVDKNCHPQTIEVILTRAEPLNINVSISDWQDFVINDDVFGGLVQYPDSTGSVHDYKELADQFHEAGARIVAATDLLALTLLKPPGEWGADMALGSAQRFGMPVGFGGPHAAFFSCNDECKRQMPGRIIGVSKDAQGNSALRLSLQTREQHIRRDKATSNICTAQALPAIVTSMYALFHGPDLLKQLAANTHLLTALLADELRRAGYELVNKSFFDTITISASSKKLTAVYADALAQKINLRQQGEQLSISFDETTTIESLQTLLAVFGINKACEDLEVQIKGIQSPIPATLARQTKFMQQAVFNMYHSETELMRYMDRLQQKDLGLTDSMIPLGSCTMKLNAAVEMTSVTNPGFAHIHPFAPADQTQGYKAMCDKLEADLAEITGFHSVSLQPNAGSQGEYAGLLAIRGYHKSNGDEHRNICLIPLSAHGTNPASAIMAGMEVVGVICDDNGNIDVADLKAKAEAHTTNLAAIMVTYPSTHGVFEESIQEICQIIHDNGGQVYLDGANMNAMVALCRPGDIGGDVCHLNLHKTFCIPHGGGGPGMGPIGVVEHLAPFLPASPLGKENKSDTGAVSAAPVGSGCILPISYSYIRMMGEAGLKQATQVAILNANYIAKKLEAHFPVLYKGTNGCVAHECILDCRHFKQLAEIEVEDIAKRLMDFGFHAPTMSWPVPGTLMIEPTESESKEELDRFIEAFTTIRLEIREIEEGISDKADNVLKHAPHTAQTITRDEWAHAYSREKAAYPASWQVAHKYWPPVARVDNVYGDRNLICTCDSVENYAAK